MKRILIYLVAVMFSIGALAARKKGKTLPCDDLKPQLVRVGLGRITILSFPLPPKEVLPGENVFDFKQIKSDLAIKALRGTSRTNVVVYLQERRCAFDLVAVQGHGDDIVLIQDPRDKRMNIQF